MQRGGCVRGDGHVLGIVGTPESTVSTMQFELVSFRFNVKQNINLLQDCSDAHGEKMGHACSQVSVHDCGNINVGNWGIVIRVRNGGLFVRLFACLFVCASACVLVSHGGK